MRPPPPLPVAEFHDEHALVARQLGHESMAWNEPVDTRDAVVRPIGARPGSGSAQAHWVSCSCGYETGTYLDYVPGPDGAAGVAVERAWAQHVIDELKLCQPYSKPDVSLRRHYRMPGR